MSRTQQNVAPALQAYFRETSTEVAIQAPMPPGTRATAPPWTGRRLQHALAELGPARPTAFDEADPVSAATLDPAPTVATPRPLPPPPRPAQDFSDQGFRHAPVIGQDLPPAVASLIAALPVQEPPLGPNEIIAALAATGPDPRPADAMNPSLGVAQLLSQPTHAEADERPPMMIERAYADRELHAAAPVDAVERQNSWPALIAGFAFALATGVALYFVLVLR